MQRTRIPRGVSQVTGVQRGGTVLKVIYPARLPCSSSRNGAADARRREPEARLIGRVPRRTQIFTLFAFFNSLPD
jgi:hypothetical protein